MPYKDKTVQREYQKNWMRKRRDDYFYDKKCEWCNSNDNLVLHHSNQKIKVSHRIWSWSEARRNKELEKCIVICESCHKEHHATLLRTFVHGVSTTYRIKGCRCDECRIAQYKTMRRQIPKKYSGWSVRIEEVP